MKKITSCFCYAVILAAVAFITASCQESKLKQAIMEADLECPISMGEIGEVTSIGYVDGNMVVNCSVDESLVDIDAIKENPAAFKEVALAMLKNGTKEIRDLKDLLLEEKAGFIMKYKGKTSGRIATVSLTYDDIRDNEDSYGIDDAPLSESDDSDPMAIIESVIKATNLQMPLYIAEGMSVTSMELEGNYVIYNTEVDEDLFSISSLRASKTELKENIMEELTSGKDPSVGELISMCKRANVGIAYRYIGNNSDETCTVYIKASEL